MNIVDSSAWLSYFSGDANAALFSNPIEDIDKLLVPGIIITEVFKCILRQRGEDMALKAIAHIEQGKVISLDSVLAIDTTHMALTLSCHSRTASSMPRPKNLMSYSGHKTSTVNH